MKKRLVLVVPLLIVAAWLAAPAFAQYEMESSCTYNDSLVLDPSANSNARVCLKQTTKDSCEKYNFCVWRDTTNQNTLADHSMSEYPGAVYTVYSSPALTVLVYQAAAGPAVTAIIGTSEMLLVGTGGSREYANIAKLMFQSYYAGFTGKNLKGIVLPSVNEEDSWGTLYWRVIFGSAVPLIVNSSYPSARAKRNEVSNELLVRKASAQGTYLTWGTDNFLGEGSMKQYRPNLPSFLPPGYTDIYISEATNITVNGNPIRLIPTFEEDAGLLVVVLRQHMTIAGNLGKFLPDAGSIIYPSTPIEKWIETLDGILAGDYGCHCSEYDPYCDESSHCPPPDYLITGRGMFMDGAQAIQDRLTAQRDALQYLHNETVEWINNHQALDDIVATVKLPADLANNPYNAEFVSTAPSIIRAIYHDHVGWFDGNPANLESLSTVEQAARLIEFGGGEGSVLNYINKCITEHSRSGALQALKMASVLRLVSPGTTVDALYVQALSFLAYTTTSAHLRNYYLTEVMKVQNPTLSISEVIPADIPE